MKTNLLSYLLSKIHPQRQVGIKHKMILKKDPGLDISSLEVIQFLKPQI